MEAAGEPLANLTLTEFTERLASDAPVPGGGSAAAIAGSFAASLLAMVARLSRGRPKYANFEATHERALQAAERARQRLLTLADDDARAYGRFSTALKLPKETDEEQRQRNVATQAAARAAAEVPLAVLRECAMLLVEIEGMAGRSNVNAASDLEVAGRLAAAAARGAAANVLVNLPHVGDQRFVGGSTAEVGDLLHSVERQMLQVAQRVAGGGLREPQQE
ncbi:MAG TPA: cyclodeaminase/cyclohydrolase family protein [Candidatus Limnocylindria bacterium]|nr:cyclodeaminase/cyclohydrolase family protein [Candidatus Limnocylindria bacterium]